jgi:adenylate cyclase
VAPKLSVFLTELKRRKVYRVAAAYAAVGLAISLSVPDLFSAFDLPSSAARLVIILIVVGFPISLVLAWAYEVRPEEPRETEMASVLAIPQGPVIAVLPFTNMSEDPADEFFTDGITEDIITGLSRFTHLFVLARNTTFRYKGQAVDVREVRRDLGAQYILEGGIRKAAHQLRVSVQLLEGRTGTHLWAQNYDRDLTAGEVFAVQDEITSQVVATLADAEGVLTRSAAPRARSKPTDSLDAYEAVLRAFSYWAHQSPREHAEVRATLERATEVDPDYSHAWACLSLIYLDELRVGFNPLPEPGRRIMESARRAVELGRDNPLAYVALASAQYFSGDLDGFFPSGERAIRLNPNDSTALATVGMLTAFGGEWERGLAMLEKAIALNPDHPGWYNIPLAIGALRQGDHEEALKEALHINMLGYYPAQMVLTAAYGHLGREEDARAAAETLLQISPDFVENGPRRIWGWQHDPLARSRLLEGLQKAGLDVRPPEPFPTGPSPA